MSVAEIDGTHVFKIGTQICSDTTDSAEMSLVERALNAVAVRGHVK